MAIHDFRSQRLFIDARLQEGKPIAASREQANYLLNVLRLGSETDIMLFNGKDGEWRSTLEITGRKKCNLIPVAQTRTQPQPSGFTYCFAPLKQARLDYMIQKAVEMGAGVLQPVITQYTQVRSVNEKRVWANMIEAAEQCGILAIPEVRPPIKIKELAQNLATDCQLIICDEEQHQANDLAELQALFPEKLALLIGPEGGFSDDDRSFVAECGKVTRLGLGPRILRADTAAVAAMAIIQSTMGDWYNS